MPALLDSPRDPVRAYLTEIGRYPLLTPEEELELGRKVQLMMNPPPDADAEELERIQKQGQRAKDKMVRSNLKLVVSVGKKYQKRGIEFLDLIQEGTVGLVRGIEKFDPARGYKLSTYCYWWIRQSITRVLAQQARTIRLPVHITEQLNKVKRTRRELAQKLGRNPTLAELASAMGTTSEQITFWLQASQHSCSIDSLVGRNCDTPMVELFASELPTPEDFLEMEDDADCIEALLAHCSDNQRRVICLRFGLADDKPLTLGQIGERIGVSRERARQLQADGFQRIRKGQTG